MAGVCGRARKTTEADRRETARRNRRRAGLENVGNEASQGRRGAEKRKGQKTFRGRAVERHLTPRVHDVFRICRTACAVLSAPARARAPTIYSGESGSRGNGGGAHAPRTCAAQKNHDKTELRQQLQDDARRGKNTPTPLRREDNAEPDLNWRPGQEDPDPPTPLAISPEGCSDVQRVASLPRARMYVVVGGTVNDVFLDDDSRTS